MPTPRLAAALCGLALVITTSTAGSPAGAEPDARAAGPLPVTGFALGSLKNGTLARDAAALDTVTVAGVGLRASGASVAAPSPEMERVRRAAAARGLDTELLLSNYSDRLEAFDPRAAHRLLASAENREAVAAQVATTAVAGGWGGVNVDLELVRAGDADGLTAFVRAVRDALDAEGGGGRTLSIDVSGSTSDAGYEARGYHLDEIGAIVDVVVLMTYDLHGPTWSGPGPIGDLRWQRRAVAAAAEEVPLDRIDLGVAGYGYTWPRRGTGHTVTPAGARRLVERDGVRATWHANSGEWSATLDDGTRLWWSDRRSVAKRQRLARELGVHGVAVWRLGSADPL